MAGIEARRALAESFRRIHRLRWFSAVLILILGVAQPLTAGADLGPIEFDGISRKDTRVDITFPVLGGSFRANDCSFLAPRSGGRRHHGQDIFGVRMQKLVAAFDGEIYTQKNAGTSGHTLWVIGDNGWIAKYRHLNNDPPGSTKDDGDGLGTDKYAFAPGIHDGVRVREGQFVGYLGDSGNAETTRPHLHFELVHRSTGAIINPKSSLLAAEHLKDAEDSMSAEEEAAEEIGPGDLHVVNGSLDLKSREILLVGTIRSVDLDEGEVVVSVSCISTQQDRYVGLQPARDKKIMIYRNTVIRAADDNGVGYPVEILHPSQSVTVIGRDFGQGSILPARVIAVTRDL